MDATHGVGSLLQGDIRRHLSFTHPANQYILGIDGVRHPCRHLLMIVTQLNGNIDRFLGEWNQKDVLEGLRCVLGFFGGKPLLEEAGEAMAIDDLTTTLIPDGELSVTLQGQLCQTLATAIPPRQRHQLVDIELLSLMVTTERIVDSEGTVLKIVFETLCPRAGHRPQQKGRKK